MLGRSWAPTLSRLLLRRSANCMSRIGVERAREECADVEESSLSGIDVHETWSPLLRDQLDKPYFTKLSTYLAGEATRGVKVFPPRALVFNALRLTPADAVKVVIVGQDPYHGPGQAEGLSFSVPPGIPLPSSLKNIFKELKADLPGSQIAPNNGSLLGWAAQGVLLLNTSLTVRAHNANSHKDIGWDVFTDAILRHVIDQQAEAPVVFLLWGKFAQNKGRKAGLYNDDNALHCVLEAPHPSGLSAHRGFIGCRHFSKTNAFLVAAGADPIDWANTT